MKRFSVLLCLLLMLGYVSTFAQKVDLEPESITPAPGEYTSFPSIVKLQFNTKIKKIGTALEAFDITDSNDAIFEDGYAEYSLSEDSLTLILTINGMNNVLGEYKIVIPEKILQDKERVTQSTRLNPEITLSYNVKYELPDYFVSASDWLSKTGVGFPADGSSGREGLKMVLSDMTSSEEEVLTALNAYLTEEDVMLPEVDKFYRIYAVNTKGDRLYLSFQDGSVVLSDDVNAAYSFKVMSGETDGTLVFKTSNGKCLHVLTNSSDYSLTSKSNLTVSYNPIVNDLLVSKLIIDGVNAESTFGLLKIFGDLGPDVNGDNQSNLCNARVGFTNKSAYTGQKELPFSETLSCAFVFEESEEPAITKEEVEFDAKAVFTNLRITDVDQKLLLTLDCDELLTLNPSSVISVLDDSGSVVTTAIMKGIASNNKFEISIGEVANGSYTVVIPKGTFYYETETEINVLKEIRKSFVVAIGVVAQEIEEPVFSEDFNNGIPYNFILLDLDKMTPPLNFDYPMGIAWIAKQDPDDNKNKFAAALSWYQEKGQADDWMILPTISMPEEQEKCQLFWRSRSDNPNYLDGYSVYVTEKIAQSVDSFNKDDWQVLYTVPPTSSQNPPEWTFKQLNLANYAGKEIRLAFVQNTRDGWMVYIDDITVGSPNSLRKGDIRLASKSISTNSELDVTFEVKAGIKEPVTDFTVRLTVGDSVVEENFTNQDLKSNEIKSYALNQKVLGKVGERVNYGVELIMDDVIMSKENGVCLFAAPLPNANKKTVAEMLYNNQYTFASVGFEGQEKATAKHPNDLIFINYAGPNVDINPLTTDTLLIEKLDVKYPNLFWSRDVLVDRKEVINVEDSLTFEQALSFQDELCVGATVTKAECTDDAMIVSAKADFALSSEERQYDYRFIIVEDSLFLDINTDYVFMPDTVIYSKRSVRMNNVARADSKVRPISGTVAFGGEVELSAILPKFSNVYEPRMLKAIFLVIDHETGEIANADCMRMTYTGTHEDKYLAVQDLSADERFAIRDGVLILNGKMSDVMVTDLQGRVLCNTRTDEDVSLNVLVRNQMVVVKVSTGNNVVTQKVVIK